MELKNLPERLLKIDKALKPIGVHVLSNYEINVQQLKDGVDIKSVTVTLFLDEAE